MDTRGCLCDPRTLAHVSSASSVNRVGASVNTVRLLPILPLDIHQCALVEIVAGSGEPFGHGDIKTVLKVVQIVPVPIAQYGTVRDAIDAPFGIPRPVGGTCDALQVLLCEPIHPLVYAHEAVHAVMDDLIHSLSILIDAHHDTAGVDLYDVVLVRHCITALSVISCFLCLYACSTVGMYLRSFSKATLVSTPTTSYVDPSAFSHARSRNS